MLTNVLESIICSEFRKEFQSIEMQKKDGHLSDPNFGMLVRFKLDPDYEREEGYRNLSLLIFGAGSNYITVMAKLDWTVIPLEGLEDEDGLKPGYDYTKGETPWVHFSNHDSCWTSDGVHNLLFMFRNRINCLDSRYDRWYEKLPLTSEQVKEFRKITDDTRNGKAIHSRKIETLEFKFPVKA